MHFPAPTHWETGWIEVVCGSMFSGKTEELIRRVKRAQIAKQKVQIFKPAMDTRYCSQSVVSHSAQALQATTLNHPEEIFGYLQADSRIVAIDEVQFFSASIVGVVQKLAEQGLRVIVAGLDLDYLAKPFGPMPPLMAVAEHVTKMHALCTVCGGAASRSQRISKLPELPLEHLRRPTEPTQSESGSPIYLGTEEAYEARCRLHFRPEIESN